MGLADLGRIDEVIDVTLAALFWAWGSDTDILQSLVKKTLYVGAFPYLFGNFSLLFQRLGGAGGGMKLRFRRGPVGHARDVERAGGEAVAFEVSVGVAAGVGSEWSNFQFRHADLQGER